MKTVVGYCDPLSVAPGGEVRLMVSAHVAGPCRLELVRVVCGDLSSKGPGFREDAVPLPADVLPETFEGCEQPLRPGSRVDVIDAPRLESLTSFTVSVLVWPTRPGEGEQGLVTTEGLWLGLDHDGSPLCRLGGVDDGGALASAGAIASVGTGHALLARRWVELRASYDADTGRLTLAMRPLPSHGPGDRVVQASASVTVNAPPGLRTGGRLRFGEGFDGKLEAPQLAFRADAARFDASWDFARGIGTNHVLDTGAGGLHGQTVQGPARGVTGSRWDGSTQRWTDQPDQYAAIHFHRDDLIDACWSPDARLTVPADLPSGFYAFKVTGPDGDVDRTPFFVRPPVGTAQAPLAFLVPTATYYAYANHRMTIDGSEFFPARSRLRPEFEYVKAHPEVGYSMYESHDDGSGVMYSSRLRPILNLKPGADGWAYSADTNLVAFLEQAGLPYDVVTDDDLHHEGRALLDRYQVVMTGSHPEYWSTSMLDALEAWLGDGGRLLYLGGNGFYWRVSWSLHEPHVMEVRRAEDGTRGWIAEAGEYYHSQSGEYGGLWRRLGRAPNQLVGIGFAAQGFDRAAPYVRSEASFDGRAAWVFEGVEGEAVIGDYGVGGGAAGQEIDRFDLSLGSPPHAVVLASSADHSKEMLRTKEEFLATRLPFRDPKVRADMVFFETPGDGAVFSVGSIAWYGALAHRGYDNDIARITTNVLRRFLDPAPFPDAPPGASAATGAGGSGVSPAGSPPPA